MERRSGSAVLGGGRKPHVFGLGFVSVLIIAGLLVLPNVAALTITLSPPWASVALNDPYTSRYAFGKYDIYQYDGHKNGNGDTLTDSLVYLPVLGVGHAVVTTYIYFLGTLWSPPADGYWTVTYYWSLTGVAELDNFLTPGGITNFQTSLGIWLHGSLADVTAGVNLADFQTTVVSASLGVSAFVEQWPYSNTIYTVGTGSTPYYLVAADKYELITYVESYNEAVVGGGGAVGFEVADVNLTVSNYQVTFDNPSFSGVGSVLSGTQILTTATTTQKVDTLKSGQPVLGWDLSKHGFVQETVLGNSYSYVSEVESINNGRLVTTVDDQPLYVRNGTWQGWVLNPADLKAGEQLFQLGSGTWLNITTIQALTGKFKVYDLQVSSPNDFIANGLLALDKKR